jgi:hypothetical protein
VLKTSAYLGAEEATRLATLAEREKTSRAEVIRRAIRSYEPSVSGDPNLAVVGSGEGPGDSLADYTEDALLDGFGA